VEIPGRKAILRHFSRNPVALPSPRLAASPLPPT
jgi:hypothetical protein